jgi:hypothetical protein
MNRKWAGIMVAGGLLAGAALSYPLFFRRRCLTWGARAGEINGPLPGDDLMPGPGTRATRAVSIGAPPSAVWPWLAQMGSGRGGAYSYDWIENLLGLAMRSADEILPQCQHLAVGDELPLGPEVRGLQVEILNPERVLTVRREPTWMWTFELTPEGDGTRLVSRNRITGPGAPAWLARTLVMEPGSLVMERKMLLGIKARAERLARARERAGSYASAGAQSAASARS